MIGMYPVQDLTSTPSAMQYAEAFFAKSGSFPSYQSASYMACLQTMHMGIAISKSLETESLRQAIANSEQSSFYGTLAFNRFGTSTKSFVTTQNNGDVPEVGLEILTPLAAATSEIIYPMPTWDERSYRPSFWTTATEKAVMATTSIALIIVALLAAVVLYLRDATVMKASSPTLLLCSLIGSSLLLCANYVWSLHTNDAQCGLRPVMVSMGFSLLFAPLFVKTFRLSRIFMSKDFTKMQVPTQQIALFVSIPILLDSAILFVWYMVDTPKAETEFDTLRPINSITSCTSSPSFVWVMLVWKMMFAAIGAALMIRSRKIPAFFNETSSTGAAIASTLFTALFVIPVAAIDTMPRNLQFALRSFGIIIGVLSTVALMLTSKLELIYDHGVNLKPTNGSATGTNNRYTYDSRRPGNNSAAPMGKPELVRAESAKSPFKTRGNTNSNYLGNASSVAKGRKASL